MSTKTNARGTPAKPRAAAAAQKEQAGRSDSDLSSLLMRKNDVMLAVEQALLRGNGAHASPPIAEQIAARLAGVIALDLLHPGQRLLENELSEVLRVSRSPVREAIRILERDRLVEVSARRGATVTAPDAQELHDIFEVRAALFTILLEQVMQQRAGDLRKTFEDFLPKLVHAAGQSPEAYAVQSFLFNLAIADLCDNRLVVDQLKAISLRTVRYVRLGVASDPDAVTRALKTWRSLYAAIVKGDVALVIETAMKRIGAVRDLAVVAVGKPASGLSR